MGVSKGGASQFNRTQKYVLEVKTTFEEKIWVMVLMFFAKTLFFTPLPFSHLAAHVSFF